MFGAGPFQGFGDVGCDVFELGIKIWVVWSLNLH